MEKKQKTTKIKNKLLLFLLPAVVVTILVLVVLSGYLSAKNLKAMATSQLDSSIANQADNIEGWLTENLQNFNTVKLLIEKSNPNYSQLQTMIDSTYGFNSYCRSGPYIATESGQVFKAENSNKVLDNPTSQEWFKQGLTRVGLAYGSTYLDTNGEQVISASGLIDDGSGQVKVFAADLTLDQISVIVNSRVKMDQAASFLVDITDKTILAHRDMARVSTKLTDTDSDKLMASIAKKINARNYATITTNGYVVAFKTIAGTDWVLVSYVPEKAIMSSVNKLVFTLVGVGIVAIVLIMLIIQFVVTKVIAPLATITKDIAAMSEGDFTIEVKQESNDEIGVMGGKVREFVESMRGMLSSINEESKKLKEESDNSDEVSKSMYEASQAQSEAMQNLNNTVDQLAIAVNEIAENATTLAMVVSDTRDNSNLANESMKEAVEISKKGRKDMEQLAVAMEDIKNSNNELVSSINDVGKASEEITKIVGLIAEIAEETNLLSLNASIEAARAGETGKGFAVVATEIGKLAQNSAQSAENISRLIDDVRAAIDAVVTQAETSARNIEKNSELINTAVETFGTIYENIETSNEKLDLMIKDVQKVDDVATNVAAISEEQAASTDEILETSRQMVEQAKGITRSSQDVADNSHELAKTSETLTSYVQQFKI
ncbi:MAG: methyl-accepting chemotaxis protein [Lachnospiraceae bacterium]|nr:methyl-accepting chemotaxis protein [Lachnospiraceae bacterium]